MRKANKDLGITLPKTVIFGEPTELKLGSSQKGIIMLKLDFEGKASHSGYPELGVSAIEHLIAALNSLLAIDWPSSPKFGKTTFNIGTINGGAAHNIVPGTPTPADSTNK
jgi:acetylornithine deacetylase